MEKDIKKESNSFDIEFVFIIVGIIIAIFCYITHGPNSGSKHVSATNNNKAQVLVKEDIQVVSADKNVIENKIAVED